MSRLTASTDRGNMRVKHKKNQLSTASCPVFNRIITRRQRGDRTYYKVEWQGQQLHTWELEDNLDPENVAEFKRKITSAEPSTSNDKRMTGFERGLEPERIVGMFAVGENETLMFKIKWKGSRARDLVTVEEAKIKCPQQVIQFYEQRISWL